MVIRLKRSVTIVVKDVPETSIAEHLSCDDHMEKVKRASAMHLLKYFITINKKLKEIYREWRI